MAAIDVEYAGIKSTYRRRVQDALKDIRNGSVEERDLDKLHNFCMVSLMLMTKVNKATWRNAEKMAEIADLLQEGQIIEVEAENKDEHPNEENISGNCVYDGSHLIKPGNETVLEHPAAVEQVTDLSGAADSGKSIERPLYDLVCTSRDEARRQGQETLRRDHLETGGHCATSKRLAADS